MRFVYDSLGKSRIQRYLGTMPAQFKDLCHVMRKCNSDVLTIRFFSVVITNIMLVVPFLQTCIVVCIN